MTEKMKPATEMTENEKEFIGMAVKAYGHHSKHLSENDYFDCVERFIRALFKIMGYEDPTKIEHKICYSDYGDA